MPKKNPREPQKQSSATSGQPIAKPKPLGQPSDVAAIRKEITDFFKTLDENGKRIGSHKWGIYAFYDYDGEPIYVGLTCEGVSSRIGRHLTNQRTDAVAMNVLDPFEVADICVWPLDLSHLGDAEMRQYLDRAEFTVFQKLLAESNLRAVLNEKPPRETAQVELPKLYRRRIIPEKIYPERKHPDVRIARRASTIANLARVISERKVARGLRATLLTQAKRLERLAAGRLDEFPKSSDDENEDA